jgi:hypothetical protein
MSFLFHYSKRIKMLVECFKRDWRIFVNNLKDLMNKA